MRSRDILLPILSLSFPILRIFSFYIFYRIISRCSRSKLIYNTVNFSASSSDISICIFSLQIISIPLFSRISNNSLFLQYNVFIFITPLIRCRRFYCYFDIANVISNLISCKALVNYFICFMAYFLSLSPPVPF